MGLLGKRSVVGLPVLPGICVAVVAVVALAGFGLQARQRHAALAQALALPPNDVTRRPALVRAAVARGAIVYANRCAGCHGTDRQGRTAIGAPALDGLHWLYGSGRVSDVERTILYGIRSGDGRARNVVEMPAFGQAGLLRPAEIDEVVAYLRSLDGHSGSPDAVAAGRVIFVGKGGCNDCHGNDAHGNADYGAPNLTDGVWNNGGDPAQLYASLYFGRHDVCPAWRGVLKLADIRALAVLLHRPPAAGASVGGAGAS